ncbi:hypothetical protein QR680_008199 [Steinernema hermaphroditum]|uniref:Uncharacterized protein n=1 Tax=Steinernema hermaphroditum TaxID=289476 RepID=A0AA39M7G1_9BILA|nr:hypothetical protein QR680_008199 [Steinernema hermaphroditum]
MPTAQRPELFCAVPPPTMRRRIACEDQSVILVTTRSPSAEEIAEVEKNKAEGQFRARLSDAKPRYDALIHSPYSTSEPSSRALGLDKD